MKTRPPSDRNTTAKVRRFNANLFARCTASDIPPGSVSLADRKQPYKERRLRADVLHRQTSLFALANSLITVLVILFALADNELVFYGKCDSTRSAAMRIVIIAASLTQIFLTVQGAQHSSSLQKVLGSKHIHTSLWCESRTVLLLLGEIAHLCVVMPPFWNFSVEIESRTQTYHSSLQDLVTFLIILRLYHVVRFVYSQSPLFLPKAQFYTHLHGIYHSPRFVLLVQMTRKPFLTLLVAGGFVLFTAGMMMHIIERNSFEHFTIYDGPWIVAITQLTVGYGELSPHTDFGRIIAIGPGLIGVCTLSLVVTFSMRELALDGQEKQLVEKLYHNQYVRVNLCETAAIYLQRWWRLRLSRRFRDPERFRKLFQCKLIHEKFLREFAVDLAGASEELEDQIRKVQASISRQFAETNRKLNQLPMLEGVAGKFSTDKFNVVAKLLICKQAYLRCRLIGGGKRRKPRRLSTLSRRHNKRSSIVEKRASDIAIRKLKARLSLIPHGNSQQFGSKEVSPDESLQSSYSKVGRRKSLL